MALVCCTTYLRPRGWISCSHNRTWETFHDTTGRWCSNQRRILFPDPARTSAISSPERRGLLSPRPSTLYPRYPSSSHWTRDWNLAPAVIAEWQAPRQLTHRIPPATLKETSTHFHIYASTQEHMGQGYWTAVGLIVAGVIFSMFLAHYFIYSYFRN